MVCGWELDWESLKELDLCVWSTRCTFGLSRGFKMDIEGKERVGKVPKVFVLHRSLRRPKEKEVGEAEEKALLLGWDQPEEPTARSSGCARN